MKTYKNHVILNWVMAIVTILTLFLGAAIALETIDMGDCFLSKKISLLLMSIVAFCSASAMKKPTKQHFDFDDLLENKVFTVAYIVNRSGLIEADKYYSLLVQNEKEKNIYLLHLEKKYLSKEPYQGMKFLRKGYELLTLIPQKPASN